MAAALVLIEKIKRVKAAAAGVTTGTGSGRKSSR